MCVNSYYEEWVNNPRKLWNGNATNDTTDLLPFFDMKLGEIERKAKCAPDQAFAELLCVVAYANALFWNTPNTLNRLKELICKIRQALASIASAEIADSYSISVGAPVGITLGLSWNAKRLEGSTAEGWP